MKERVPKGEAEVAFAEYMDLCGIRWEYEATGFPVIYVKPDGRFSRGHLFPDFYLVDMGIYVEIKNSDQGVWDFRSKYRAFKVRYPEIKIKVLTKNDLRRMGIIGGKHGKNSKG